jgi:hypothetical protein
MIGLDMARQRLLNQRLIGTPLETPEAVVRWLGAVQSQDYAGAKWAVAQRTTGVINGEMDRLFDAGRILRTHVMRPTWHFVLPEDIRWLLKLTAPRVHAVNAYYYRQLGLDDGVFEKSETLLAKALQGGRQLTRPELVQALQEGGISASGPRLAYILMHAELDGILCSGALRGKQFTYALLDDRVPATRTLEREEALAELTRRYFTSHGPATVQDYMWWSGLSAAEARAGIERMKSSFVQEIRDGKTYWFAEATATATENDPIVHLLPNYDEHLVAYKDHSPSFEAEVYQNLAPQEAALMAHVVVRKGYVIGGWRRTLKTKEALVTASLLVALDPMERAALEAALGRYSQFLGMPVTLL